MNGSSVDLVGVFTIASNQNPIQLTVFHCASMPTCAAYIRDTRVLCVGDATGFIYELRCEFI